MTTLLSQDRVIPKMDPEYKAIWLEALRSGKYRQCQGKLHDWDGFCCLGVLQDIAVPDCWEPGRNEDTARTSEGDEEIITGYGLTYEAINQLTDMNDSGDSFETIADWIEENL